MLSGIKSLKEPEVTSEDITYSVRLNYVIFPLEFRDLRNILAKNGYELARIEGRIPPRPTRIAFTGEIARKGEVSVYFDSSEGEIAVQGRSLEEIMTGFEQLSKVIQTELGIDINSSVWYYQLVAHYTVKTGTISSHAIHRVFEGNPHLSKFNEILGVQTSMFSIRLSPVDQIPNAAEWFDIAIEPDILNVEAYHIGVVFRNPNRARSEDFIKNLQQVLFNLLKVIEGKR